MEWKGWGDAFTGSDLPIWHNFTSECIALTDRSANLKPAVIEPIDSGRGPGFAGAALVVALRKSKGDAFAGNDLSIGHNFAVECIALTERIVRI